jgi:hypothetical protein
LQEQEGAEKRTEQEEKLKNIKDEVARRQKKLNRLAERIKELEKAQTERGKQ